jgi:hypothetical protein
MANKRAVVDYHEQICSLMDMSAEMPPGPAKIGLIEEAVRLADVHADEPMGYAIRLELMEAATFGGQADLMLVAFGWCLALADKSPAEYGGFDLLWKYKWVLSNGVEFPQISRVRLESMLEDLHTRFEAFGCGEQPYLQAKRNLHLNFGEPATAMKIQKKLDTLDSDMLSDCQACDQNEIVRMALASGDYSEAIKRAKPILSGEMTCAEIPQLTIAMLLEPWVLHGDAVEAASRHACNYKAIQNNPGFLRSFADHLGYLVLTDDLKRAAKMVERHLATALQTKQHDPRFRFYVAVLMFITAAQRAGQARVKLKLPTEFPLFDESHAYNLAALAEWFSAEADQLATAFDVRNGNRTFKQYKVERLKCIAVPPAAKSRNKT